MIKFYIEKDCSAIAPELVYLLKLWARNQQVDIAVTVDEGFSVGLRGDSKIKVSHALKFNGKPRLSDSCLVLSDASRPDFLATAFYMLNSLQEFDDKDRDELNRFKYSNSYQFKFNNAKENIVQGCFNEISKQIGLPSRTEETRFFLSHDIDTVNGAILEDGFNVLKRGRIDLFLQMLFNVAIGRPDWLNIDKIMTLESEYDCRSTFFWIVNKGKVNNREKNADYSFSSKSIQRQVRRVEQMGFENGLHKSISKESFNQELRKFGNATSNRYHYLKFHLPDAYHQIEGAGLKLDASLGFAEEIGFRNSYGLPFNPYDFKSRKPFSFVEVPLHIMDRTYFQYKKYDVQEAEKDIIGFFERNKQNCVISVLWHNNFFTNYKFKGYLDLYKRILGYIRDNNLRTISQGEITKRYSIV